ncbi:MAG: YifB family Mg chelatase-like AAA ATPase [Candidatus Omnitrophica bacterium]|nr:YifB family Mg chelatase-like AAA ATPase [Candidatus Omnitrophota bacterium]MDD5488429.1 YifB family Mg chelatase-like AAA ATPase [Candidatus Omnitrophota bacterium]
MLSKTRSACNTGVEACAVDVEVDISGGLPCFTVVGLPDTAIKESRDRIRSAIRNSGFHFPSTRVTVNLSPADTKKEGAGLDLPIAIGVLACEDIVDVACLEGTAFVGELSLNGRLKPLRGALSAALALKDRCKAIILPAANAEEASHIKGVEIYGARGLREVIDHLKGLDLITPAEPVREDASAASNTYPDMRDVKGQEHVKRALEVAASGGHNILMIGPPGSGKSMLAKRFPGILPDLSHDERLEATNIHSISGLLKNGSLIRERPFRSPHHTISYAAMVGGGTSPMPGEITLSHHGVLFLDEFPEFRRDVLETLRQPMETGEVTITRVQRSSTYPSRFLLIAAMNPCPCGYFTDPRKQCHCSAHQIQKYLSKISGPLLDRIDIHVEVPRLSYENLSGRRTGESSTNIKERVLAARNIQSSRFGPERVNANMGPKDIETYCKISDEAEKLLKTAILELGISARAYHKILKISLTIADMDSSDIVTTQHISEAIGYRTLDRGIWH